MAGSQERTIPIPKVGTPERRAEVPKRPVPPPPPPEPSPSPRTLEARKTMTEEEVGALADFVTQLTESSTVADSIKEQRRLLFAIGNELKRLKPDSAQAVEVLSRMKGFQLALGGKRYQVEEYLTRGTFGAAFVVKEVGSDTEDVLKLSLPFDRGDMFVKANAGVRDVLRAEQIRSTIMEAAAMYRVSHYDAPPNRPKELLRRKDAFPPFPLLTAAQFIPHPDDPNQRIQALVMEKIEGQRLDQIVSSMDLAQDPNLIRKLTKELLMGLRHIHNRGVSHSDIKLSNIILDADFHPYFLDFGAAQVGEIAGRQFVRPSDRVVYGHADHVIGTKDYTTGFETPSSPRDIYALGVVLSKIIQGNHLRRKKDTLESRMRKVPSEIQEFVELANRMTAENPEKRPTLDEILGQL